MSHTNPNWPMLSSQKWEDLREDSSSSTHQSSVYTVNEQNRGLISALGYDTYRNHAGSILNTPMSALKSASRVIMAQAHSEEEKPNQGWRDTVPVMLGSASAGMVARVVCHPLDTAKAKMQAHLHGVSTATLGISEAPTSIRQVLSQTFHAHGIRGLYAGFWMAFVGSAPAACLYFTAYETLKPFFARVSQTPHLGENTMGNHFVSGLGAEVLSCVLWVPIDVIKERLQVQSLIPPHLAQAKYRGTLHAIRTIAKHEGFRGIYKGYGATVASFGPFSALYLTGYEWLKQKFVQRLNSSTSSNQRQVTVDNLPLHYMLFSGATSGAFASFITNPLDLVKLRLQIQRRTMAMEQQLAQSHHNPFAFGYRNIGDGLVKVVQTEGVSGLFKGATARMAFSAPATAVTISCFDFLKNKFKALLEPKPKSVASKDR